jgi:hypothetical protein
VLQRNRVGVRRRHRFTVSHGPICWAHRAARVHGRTSSISEDVNPYAATRRATEAACPWVCRLLSLVEYGFEANEGGGALP